MNNSVILSNVLLEVLVLLISKKPFENTYDFPWMSFIYQHKVF